MSAVTTVLLITCALAATLLITALVIGWWSTTPRGKSRRPR